MADWFSTQKPSFLTELLALPPKESHQVLDKIKLLVRDPTPDGKVKKQLKYMGGKLHRLRAGRYRIFYTFEQPYISLLALRQRDDDTYDDAIDAEFYGGLNPDFPTTPQAPQFDWESLYQTYQSQTTPLPEAITPDLLNNLRIPAVCHTRLLAVTTREELFDCPGIPDEVILKLDEYLFEKPLIEVLQQPDFVAQDVSDLLRFKEGDLLGFLLKLNPEQEKFVTWATTAQGPTLLKGGPGTGKSTVALYRTREILQQLQAEGTARPKLLFTTYTNALVKVSEQLLEQLLGPAAARLVEVKTADKIMQALIYRTGGTVNAASHVEEKRLLKAALAETLATLEGNRLQQQAQTLILERLDLDYLLEEIQTVIVARGLANFAEYRTAPRPGRLVPLNKTQRQAIWQLYQAFQKQLAQAGLETWSQVRQRALHCLAETDQPPIYDAVIVDEAQDLEVNVLRFLVQICRAPNRLFITADANQSIYGGSFRWRDVHTDLKFVGRTGVLRVNHRTTREINEAAHAYVQTRLIDPEVIERQYIHTGPPPAVRSVATADAQAQLLAQFCRMAAREFRLGIGACAILTPTEKAGQAIAEHLRNLNLQAQFMPSREVDLTRPGVKVLTLKAAKGLDFPIVAIAGFLGNRYPYLPANASVQVKDEILQRERRTLFVGMTRAMRALLVVVPERKPSVLLQGFDANLWNLGKTTA